MAPRFIWGFEQMEAFFSILRGSYPDYLRAKELRRMDEFYENIGACIGADGLVVQNFLKKTGRAYRNILLQAETGGEDAASPDRKLRGSARVYRLYEEYYQMYYLGATPSVHVMDDAAGVPGKLARLGGRKRKGTALQDVKPSLGENKKRPRPTMVEDVSADVIHDEKDEGEYLILEDESEYTHIRVDAESVLENTAPLADHLQVTDHLNAEEVVSTPTRIHVSRKKVTTTPLPGREQLPQAAAAAASHRSPTSRVGPQYPDAGNGDNEDGGGGNDDDDVFGKGAGFQERFLKLMENQNHILSNIVEELSLIRHAVLDANGLQTITYVK